MSSPTRTPARELPPLTTVVGPGGVGKTTLAAALGVREAAAGRSTLVMTFDPSRRLREALGLAGTSTDDEVPVPDMPDGLLHVSLLDARRTFDRVIERHAPNPESSRRVLENRFYKQLAGSLAGVLEYMAVERLLEVWEGGRYQRVILDTPPARNALDFLDAPKRIMAFLDSGALKIALRPWFDAGGRLRAAVRLGPLGKGLEGILDRLIGVDLLREMAEFFQAFGPLYAGFRERAERVQALLTSTDAGFLLVTTPAPDRVADTMFFARALLERGHDLRAVVANRIHPSLPDLPSGGHSDDLCAILRWVSHRDSLGLDALRDLLGTSVPLATVPLAAKPPIGPEALAGLADHLEV